MPSHDTILKNNRVNTEGKKDEFRQVHEEAGQRKEKEGHGCNKKRETN